MAIINRFFIQRYKEILIDVPAGTIDDGRFSTFQLDDPTNGTFGTSDFFGVIKQVVLIGEVVKEVIDTNPRRLRQDPIPVGRFQQLTPAEFENLKATGEIVANPGRQGNRSEIIGWIELGKTFPSFYYQSCITTAGSGKQPRSDNYYDLETLDVSQFLVSGQGDGPQALQRLGNWRYQETFGNWGTQAYPEQIPLSFEEYMRVVTNGGEFGNDSFTYLTERSLIQIPVLLANRDEHFDGNTTTVLERSFSDPLNPSSLTNKTVFGRVRRIISEGFRPFPNQFKSNLGGCLLIGTVAPPPPPPPDVGDGNEDTIAEPELPKTYDYTGIEDESNISPDVEVDDTEPLSGEKPPTPCDRGLDLPIRIFSNGVYVGTGSVQYDGAADAAPENAEIITGQPETSVESPSILLYNIKQNDQVSDPRSLGGNNLLFPRGTWKSLLNKNNCTIEIHEDYRDKDGDIPEIVGPIMTQYMEDLREKTMNRFFTNSPLELIGYGTDGYDYYSDGNSYLELHGDSIFGCGKSFSIADIPEIFNEMYPVAIRDGGGRILFGKDESDDVTFYRKTFERPTQISKSVLDILKFVFPNSIPASLLEKRGLLVDMINDFVLGIPDLDFALVGDDSVESDLVNAGNAIITGLFSPDTSAAIRDVLNLFIADDAEYLGLQLPADEERKLKSIEEKVYGSYIDRNTIKPRPTTMLRYRSYNSFWKRSGLDQVYWETALDDAGKNLIKTLARQTDKEFKDVELIFDKTVRELRTAQYKLSYPSRWKAMMRPIYQKLWANPDEIKPENVATRIYLGENILELELGDYESHRSQFRLSKNLYDRIDDAISFRIHDDVFLDLTQEFDTINMLITDIAGRIIGFFDESLGNLIPQNIFRAATSINNLVSNAKNLDTDNFGSYIELANDILEVYKNTVGTISDVRNAIDSLGELFRGNTGELEAGLKEGFIQLGFSIIQNSIRYGLESMVRWLSSELNRKNPPRSSFSPRRTFKHGTVYLRSKSGFYITNKQPCPIIFLGFNDESVMSSFSEYNGQLDCLSLLQKTDKFETQKYIDTSKILQADALPIMRSIQPTLGNVGNLSIFRGQDSGKNPNEYNPNNPTDLNPITHTIPTINKRIRQYGKNPLLDIFYLNLIPEAYANAQSWWDKSKLPAYTHRTSTPMPFRYPNKNDWAGNRQFTKDYSTPSYFPPHWNEPMIMEGSPEQFFRDKAIYKYGDQVLFLNRQAGNILSAEDRWTMNLETVSGMEILVLNDKTRILDIYFGLMEMHVKGFSWGEIIQYIKIAKNAIKIARSNVKIGQGWEEQGIAIQKGSSIDLEKLELLWKVIEARLNGTPLFISQTADWFKVEPYPAFAYEGLGRDVPFGEWILALFIKNLDSPYRRELYLMNTTDSSIKLKSFEIKDLDNNLTDVFGNRPKDMFYVGNNVVTDGNTSGVNFVHDFKEIVIPPLFKADKIDSTVFNGNITQPFWVWFIPYGAQPNFNYNAILELTYEINGEEFKTNTILTASTINKPSVRNWSEDLISVSPLIHFGQINDPFLYETESYPVTYQNYSRENIKIDKLEIQNERILDNTGNDITLSITETPDFFIFENEPPEFRKSISPNTKLLQLGTIDNLRPTIGDDIPEIIDGPKIVLNMESLINDAQFISDHIYVGDVLITFSLNPRLNSTERITRTIKTQLRFSTLT